MSGKIVPLFPPSASRDSAMQRLKAAGITAPVALLGLRGYYLDEGAHGVNDRGIYDDAILLLAPECLIAYNANCDPSLYREGIATLKPGTWFYKLGIHKKSYKALVQARPVTVERDQGGAETGFFGINIHKGSFSSTSSLGCQTIYPSQWNSFITTVELQMKKHEQREIPYLLMDHEGR